MIPAFRFRVLLVLTEEKINELFPGSFFLFFTDVKIRVPSDFNFLFCIVLNYNLHYILKQFLYDIGIHIKIEFFIH